YVFGNLFEQSIEEIWGSERAQWYRRQIPAQCLECIEFSRCRGGARSVTVEYGLEGDRLMKEPIRQPVAETIELDPAWKPIPYFTVREESFGYLLCRLNWSVPVTHDARPLLEAINGQNTVERLYQEFGEDGLQLLGHLYREDCIGFE
ncbi:hypothetical protein GF339_18165, partial [candidate division KSB3 bacterium]|nr:hypothetical protein [candidate division KSB3 bacterium]MBD3326515.1 hypothetical protein [candidate division KSB3 bacterium]